MSSELLSRASDLLQRALQGDEAAARELGSHRDGLLVLARNGVTAAQTLLGRISISVTRDYDDASIWLALAVEADEPDRVALRLLGFLHEHGDGVAEDPLEAAQLYQRAAKLGDALAAFNLGSMHLDGRGVVRDLDLAMKWLSQSARDDDYPAAWDRIGKIHEERGDAGAAQEAFTKAAERGVVTAMARLAARARMAGDLDEAARWCFRRNRSGDAGGIHELFSFARSMSDDALRRAADLAGDRSAAESAIAVIRRRG